MTSIKRFPYYLAQNIWSQETCRLLISNPSATGFPLEKAFPLGLPIDIANFIHMHCKCAYCGSRIAKNLRRCSCGEPKSEEFHMEVEYPTNIDKAIFTPIINREQSRIKNTRRKQRLESNGGAFSKDDVVELYRYQEGLCYFCGMTICIEEGNNPFHVDHYHAIYDGGRNDISNLVLTCPSCNLKKGAMHGDDFERIAKKLRAPDIGRKLGKIRKNLNQYLARRNKDSNGNL